MPEPPPAAAPCLERIVSATLGEFVRGLDTAFPGAVNGEGERFRAQWNGATMDIELRPLPPYVVGRLSLPSLAVRIRFDGGAPEANAAMLRRLDLATHRGGG